MRLFIYSGFAEKTFLKQRKGYCDGDRCIGPARIDAAGSPFITVTAAPGAGLHVKHTTPASLEVRLRGGVSQMNTSDAYGTMKFCFAAELSELDGKAVFNNDPRL